jgi:hypothetical protein
MQQARKACQQGLWWPFARHECAGFKQENREQLQFELMGLAQEVWGSVSLVSLRRSQEWWNLWIYAKAYHLNVENPCALFSRVQAQRYFGEEATVKLGFSPGGWRISLPNGCSAVIGLNSKREKLIVEAVGGSEIFAAAILLLKEIQGYAIVAGSQETVLAGIAQGDTMGIEVIPELYPDETIYKKIGLVCGMVCGSAGLLIGILNDNVVGGVVGGILGAMVACMICGSFVARGGIQRARQKGQALKSSFPEIHGGNRKATLDEARERECYERHSYRVLGPILQTSPVLPYRPRAWLVVLSDTWRQGA